MRAAGAGGAHSLASSIVFSVFCIVSLVFISLVIIISEHTVATAVVNGRHSMWMTRAAEVARHLRSVRVPDVSAASRPTVSQWPVTRARQPTFDVRARAWLRESMCMAGEARTRAACVSSVLCTRVLVCRAQGSERGHGSGEAEGVRDRGFVRKSLL